MIRMFITFEGSDGSGKTTQVQTLCAYLKQCGYDVVLTREPGGTLIGDQVRRVLLDLGNADMLPEAEVLLFSASRAQLIGQLVQPALERGAGASMRTTRLFPYGVSQNRLRQAAKALGLPIVIVDKLRDANAVVTLKSYYRKRPRAITEAERMGIPIYVLRSNTVTQMEGALLDIFGLEGHQDPLEEAIREAQEAIEQIRNRGRDMVELRPQNSYIRRQQHEMARAAELISHSRGKEPRRRVRIYRQ